MLNLSERVVVAIWLYIMHVALIFYILYPRRRQYWVHPMNLTRVGTSMRNRIEQLKDYPDRFFTYFRMSPQTFDYVLNAIKPRITRTNTSMRDAIDCDTRLYVTLHFLSSGCSYQNIATHYALGRSTVSCIVMDTCKAIQELLGPIYLAVPQSHDQWRRISERYIYL